MRAPHISHIFVSVVSALLAGRADCAFAQHSGSGHDSGQETARSASAHAGATEGADGQAAAQGNVTIPPAPAATTHTPAPNSPVVGTAVPRPPAAPRSATGPIPFGLIRPWPYPGRLPGFGGGLAPSSSPPPSGPFPNVMPFYGTGLYGALPYGPPPYPVPSSGVLPQPGSTFYSYINPWIGGGTGGLTLDSYLGEVNGLESSPLLPPVPQGPDPIAPDGPKGGLRLKVGEALAAVWADGYYAGLVSDFNGRSQRFDLTPGHHHITIIEPSFRPLDFDVDVQPNRTIEYRGTMERVGP